MSLSIEITPDPAHACAAMLLGAASGGGHVVLTGGSTPATAYGELARAVGEVGVDLSDTTLWFGDERCVAAEDDRSNYKLARDSLLANLADENQPRVMRMRGELGPHEGARAYETTLQEEGTPEFDLLLLGLGPDGHCASLFPGQDTLKERSRLVLGVPEAGLAPFVPRISLSLATLCSAPSVVFLVSGSAKADAVAAAFGADSRPSEQVPSSLVAHGASGEVTVLLDPEAAAKL